MGGCTGGKSFGCSQTCAWGSTRPSVISAQKGQVVVPSRRLMRCGALTRYWRRIGFQIKAVSACISYLSYFIAVSTWLAVDGVLLILRHLRCSPSQSSIPHCYRENCVARSDKSRLTSTSATAAGSLKLRRG